MIYSPQSDDFLMSRVALQHVERSVLGELCEEFIQLYYARVFAFEVARVTVFYAASAERNRVAGSVLWV